MAKADPNKARARVGNAPGSIRINPDQVDYGTDIVLRIADDTDCRVCSATLKRGAARSLAKRMLELTARRERTCEICGCTDSHACPGGCSWQCKTPPVCSACASGRGGLARMRKATKLLAAAGLWNSI